MDTDQALGADQAHNTIAMIAVLHWSSPFNKTFRLVHREANQLMHLLKAGLHRIGALADY
jgi:hypothetical protein